MDDPLDTVGSRSSCCRADLLGRDVDLHPAGGAPFGTTLWGQLHDRDGKRYDNLREIKDDIRQTLADAQQIGRQADGQAVIEEAEQEVLESIGDPAERQKLKKILKN